MACCHVRFESEERGHVTMNLMSDIPVAGKISVVDRNTLMIQ